MKKSRHKNLGQPRYYVKSMKFIKEKRSQKITIEVVL